MRTLFTSDRMIVKGELGANEANDRFISIDFIFQVNGKITEYKPFFYLEEQGDSLFVANPVEWYNVVTLFWSMGYKFTEDTYYREPQYGILDEWVNELYKHEIFVKSNTGVVGVSSTKE